MAHSRTRSLRQQFSAAIYGTAHQAPSFLDQIRAMQPEARKLLITGGVDHQELAAVALEAGGDFTPADPNDSNTYHQQLAAVYALGIAMGLLIQPDILAKRAA